MLTRVSQASVTASEDDLALVARARAGDALAFELLLEPRFWRLNRLALSITANDADAGDAIQESCLQAWRELPRLRDPSRFDVWLWRIVVNSCRTAIRKRMRHRIHEITLSDDPDAEPGARSTPGPGDALSSSDLIRRAFARLDADKRSVLILHHVDGRPLADIAKILRIPEGTAKWRLYAARQALERALEVERR